MNPSLQPRAALFERLALVAETIGDSRVAEDARELALQDQRGDLNVLVVGQFKRGKSTLVNALLNEDLMPTGVLPVTGVVTALRYGEERSIRVHFDAGPAIWIGPGQLADFVSESGNPKNVRGVKHVDVTWPAPVLLGLALFDTPGVGSTWEHNSAATREVLPRADAAILVVGPDPPIGLDELAFAREIAGSADRLFIVLNKADMSSALYEVVAFTDETLARVLARPFDINILSAGAAREAQRRGEPYEALDTFVGRLRAFVRAHGNETRLRSLRRRALVLVDRLDRIVAMKRKALTLSVVELQHAREAVTRALQLLDDRIRTFELLVDDDVRSLRLCLGEDLERMKRRDEAALGGHAEDLATKSDVERRTALFAALLAERADAWRSELIERIRGTFVEAERKYGRILADIEGAAINAGCEALQIEQSQQLPSREITIPRPRVDYIPSLSPQTGLELLIGALIRVLPRGVRVRLMQRRLRTLLVQELDALSGKMRYGIASDLESWRQATRSAIASSLASTRDLVLRAFNDEPVSEPGRFEQIDVQVENLTSIRRALSAHSNARPDI